MYILFCRMTPVSSRRSQLQAKSFRGRDGEGDWGVRPVRRIFTKRKGRVPTRRAGEGVIRARAGGAGIEASEGDCACEGGEEALDGFELEAAIGDEGEI